MNVRTPLLFSIILLCFLQFGSANSQTNYVTNNLTSIPLVFTKNKGQWDEQVLYRANVEHTTMWLTADAVFYQFTRRMVNDNSTTLEGYGVSVSDTLEYKLAHIETMIIKVAFVGANPAPLIQGEGIIGYRCNYFIGNDPNKWFRKVPSYQAIIYKDIYDGIDLKYYGNGQKMEYDFICKPGADISQIQIKYENVISVSIDASGKIVIKTKWNTITETQPHIYQENGNDRREIMGGYRILGDGVLGFELNSNYNPNLPVVIDPVFDFSAYMGGNDDDMGNSITFDASGAAYVTGSTRSTDFPTTNSYQEQFQGGYDDIFITKLSSTGDSLIYSTYLGGSDGDYGSDIVVDFSGAVYVSGITLSDDFPTMNPYLPAKQGSIDVIVAKLNSNGDSLIYSTYIGGRLADCGESIAIDSSGNAYITGWTDSDDYPTLNPYQLYQGGRDIFVTKLNSSGNNLLYSTYLGGDDEDRGYGITIDLSGAFYLTGFTASIDFPINNPYQAFQGIRDVFVTKFSNNGDSLLYSTYIGGSLIEEGRDIVVDDSGVAYIAGWAVSDDFPTVNPYQPDQDTMDVIVFKLSSSGDSLLYSTYIGGNSFEGAYSIAIDSSGAIYITGYTSSSDYPVINNFQPFQGSKDAFVTKLNKDGSSLLYSAYLGGNDEDIGRGIATNASGVTYITGYTYSSDFTNVFPYKKQSNLLSSNAFMVKIGYASDVDGDWIADSVDNCPDTQNTDQHDTDTNGIGDACCCVAHGNVDDIIGASGPVDVADLSYMVAYIFLGGSVPPCPEQGNVNGEFGVGSLIDVSDLSYLVAYLFKGGPPPPACP